ncbi:MAG TPA: T9SS type A sorting domain-containing protein [Candidatus Kapabacteria bacterium]|nr:T9SS type A sorting domain-containing protein [Candidatus Kapabacteria bacterium]
MRIVTISVLLCVAQAYCQSTYAIRITPGGTYQTIDSLPGVQGILSGDVAYNAVAKQFIYISANADAIWHITLVNATTGATVASTPFIYASGSTDDNINEIQFDDSTQTLYGIDYVSSERRNYFAMIDPNAGTFLRLDSIPGMRRINPGSSVFDQVHHRFTFIGGDRDLQWRLYSVNAADGSLFSDSLFPQAGGVPDIVGELQHDDSTNMLYGIDSYTTGTEIDLVRLDPASGAFTKYFHLHDVKSVNPASVAYDQRSHSYIFTVQDTTNGWVMYIIPTLGGDGNVIPLDPNGISGRVIALFYDTTTNSLYGLGRDSTDITIGVREQMPQSFQLSAYPNPFADRANIQLNGTYQTVTAHITNSLGEALRTETFHGASTISLERNGLPDGLYFISLIADGKRIGAFKLGIE